MSYDVKYGTEAFCVAFSLNTGKHVLEKSPYLDTFHAVLPTKGATLTGSHRWPVIRKVVFEVGKEWKC